MEPGIIPQSLLEFTLGNLAYLPSVMLQTGALIGIFASLIIFNDKQEIENDKSYKLGFALGITSFILTGFMSEWLNTPVKTLLQTDFIFLAGFLGGFRNAFLTAFFVISGRVLFGGITNSAFVAVDVFTIAFLSSLLRYYYVKKNKNYMSLWSGFKLILWRLLIVETPVVFLYFTVPSVREISETIMMRRFVGGFSFSVFIVFAVIALLNREKERINQLYCDVFTGLPNRRAFQKEIENTARFPKKERSVFLVDIKNFSHLLQEMGHDWVDNFRLRLSKALLGLSEKRWLSPYGPAVYSFSDHSFVLILDGISMTHVEQNDIGYRIYNALLQNTYEENGGIRPWLTISVFDITSKHTDNARHFLQTLTLAERRHEGTVQYFKPDIMEQIQGETYTRQLVEDWIRTKRVPLWLQPKVSLKEKCCAGAEALLRARDHANGARFLSPPEVFSIAARNRMLEDLEWATVETIVSYLETMPADLRDIPLSLNLSPLTFSQPGFGERVCALLTDRNIEGHRLLIEIIETSEIRPDAATVRENARALNEKGVKLSLDDFGTGYASISLLARLDFKELKLDYSMISNMEDPRVWEAIILSVDGAKRYNAIVVAEGIETIDQHQKLLSIGIEKGQGYLFGKAMEFDDFVCYAKEHPFCGKLN